ncbi:MAG: sulfite exporter TauE/SafE family protein [Leptolyngbyaceae cyanobacterium SL_5_9]|nr:sulfite exporter TauE/SafE family protein [Leptolyngbyaceae cyanobacterium SL_5_9]NJO74304.1 sulfite exporter TauE/SafE family protein [Leptolyngbyaceae cyanobacterium RM1_406_9]
MLDLLLIAALGFLGSFGHCAGMCGPITVAFSLSQQREKPSWQKQIWFHGLLNVGRILSYALVGAGIGALSSVLIAGGQFAGVDSALRQCMAMLTGILLIWFGLSQISPDSVPHLPLLHPLTQKNWHSRLSSGMVKLSLSSHWWTPALLGMVWGLIPCGFLYAAQIKAAETGSPWIGSVTMLAFGLGTLPLMFGVGMVGSLVSGDRRSQLFRMGGWLTLTIGILTLLRTGDMVDLTGYASLICLSLALIARPISRLWRQPLRYRRALGVGAFILALTHMSHMLTMGWNVQAIPFLLPTHQIGSWAGLISLVLLTPLAFTSSDRMVKWLGKHWRSLHLLSIPAFILAAIHAILLGSHYLGGFEQTLTHQIAAVVLGAIALLVVIVRSRHFWSLLALEKFYVFPHKD